MSSSSAQCPRSAACVSARRLEPTSLTVPFCRLTARTLGDNFAEAKESSIWRKDKVLQIGAFGLLANEAHASMPTAPLLEAPTNDPLDLEHALTVRDLAQNDAFLDADDDAFFGAGDGAGRRRRSCGP
jgi:hypothetical protein